jgi:hypothetical protein
MMQSPRDEQWIQPPKWAFEAEAPKIYLRRSIDLICDRTYALALRVQGGDERQVAKGSMDGILLQFMSCSFCKSPPAR